MVAFANSAGQRLSGRTTVAILDGIARTRTSDGSGRAASVRIADLDGGVVGAEATPPSARVGRSRRPRARPLRGRPRAGLRRQHPRLPGAARLQRAGGRGGPVVRHARARSSSMPPSRSPTTSSTRWRSASRSTPRERRSGGSTSCATGVTSGLVHDRRTAKALGRRVDRQRRCRRRPVRRPACEPGPRARRGFARRAGRQRSSEGCSSPTSGTPASSTLAPRW